MDTDSSATVRSVASRIVRDGTKSAQQRTNDSANVSVTHYEAEDELSLGDIAIRRESSPAARVINVLHVSQNTLENSEAKDKIKEETQALNAYAKSKTVQIAYGRAGTMTNTTYNKSTTIMSSFEHAQNAYNSSTANTNNANACMCNQHQILDSTTFLTEFQHNQNHNSGSKYTLSGSSPRQDTIDDNMSLFEKADVQVPTYFRSQYALGAVAAAMRPYQLPPDAYADSVESVVLASAAENETLPRSFCAGTSHLTPGNTVSGLSGNTSNNINIQDLDESKIATTNRTYRTHSAVQEEYRVSYVNNVQLAADIQHHLKMQQPLTCNAALNHHLESYLREQKHVHTRQNSSTRAAAHSRFRSLQQNDLDQDLVLEELMPRQQRSHLWVNCATQQHQHESDAV